MTFLYSYYITQWFPPFGLGHLRHTQDKSEGSQVNKTNFCHTKLFNLFSNFSFFLLKYCTLAHKSSELMSTQRHNLQWGFAMVHKPNSLGTTALSVTIGLLPTMIYLWFLLTLVITVSF